MRVVGWLLETLFQRHIPDSPPDIGHPLVVAGFEPTSDKRRILVEHVVHPKRDRDVIQPCPPPTWIVLRRRNRRDVLIFAIPCPRVLAAVPGISGDLVLRGRRRQVKRVVQNEIQCCPFTNFAARNTTAKGGDAATVPILPDVVSDETGVESAEP